MSLLIRISSGRGLFNKSTPINLKNQLLSTQFKLILHKNSVILPPPSNSNAIMEYLFS